jgi:hypothetical protein
MTDVGIGLGVGWYKSWGEGPALAVNFGRFVMLRTCSVVGNVAITCSTLTTLSPLMPYLSLIAASCAFSTWFSLLSSTTRVSSIMSL